MGDNSNSSLTFNLYEEQGHEETTLDISSQGLATLPKIENKMLCILYLQNNKIKDLPDDFFETLPYLTWFDMRDNELCDIPKSIKNHQNLSHLLLQNNKLSTLPNELGTVVNLKVLQISGNPLTYPPKEIINAGTAKIVQFLHKKFIDEQDSQLRSASVGDENSNLNTKLLSETDLKSYNSVYEENLKGRQYLSVLLSEKDVTESEIEFYSKNKGKCPKLATSRKKTSPCHTQSSKYLKPVYARSKEKQDAKITQTYLREMALKKQKDLMASKDKILQSRKNLELLKNFRKTYRTNQLSMPRGNTHYKRTANDYPYDTNPEYMTLLTRDDIEKDLPDKYKKRLWRRPKPTVPRKKNGDVHLAMKIKKLFETLEAIDLNKREMTPRTEQKMLLNEIHKITEIKQKLMELSANNSKSVETEKLPVL
ncbi:Leucine-rich repeat-containing protein 27 [Papilio xuthus]|uniref:Leucine-rich repeat-containing protein 27 n=1 Tax=Papilio xuthus TaxID=66420 RepID=A0A194QI73_PAPXU|nr:Leucine-rich repeat-containing protein 27 [Papilio xuthus]